MAPRISRTSCAAIFISLKAEGQSRSLTTKFKTWLEAKLKKLPEKSDLTKAIRNGLSRWQALTLFLDDPGVRGYSSRAYSLAYPTSCLHIKKSAC